MKGHSNHASIMTDASRQGTEEDKHLLRSHHCESSNTRGMKHQTKDMSQNSFCE